MPQVGSIEPVVRLNQIGRDVARKEVRVKLESEKFKNRSEARGMSGFTDMHVPDVVSRTADAGEDMAQLEAARMLVEFAPPDQHEAARLTAYTTAQGILARKRAREEEKANEAAAKKKQEAAKEETTKKQQEASEETTKKKQEASKGSSDSEGEDEEESMLRTDGGEKAVDDAEEASVVQVSDAGARASARPTRGRKAKKQC